MARPSASNLKPSREAPVSDFTDFLEELLHGGRIVFERPPSHSGRDRAKAKALLEDVYADYVLEIAGPAIEFDPARALQAAELTWLACWLLVSQDEDDRSFKLLEMGRLPRSPAEHLSADLLLRFLPQVHRRAKGKTNANQLAETLARILRQWPLSGALAQIEEPPLTDLDFGGHPGLMLLYAERLATAEKAGWTPGGQALEYVEWVFQERGKTLSVPAYVADDEKIGQDDQVEDDGNE